jgi:triacylglycerol lipase
MSETLNYRLALFLLGVCHQTYMQYNDAVGRFIIPAGFRYVASFSADAFGASKEAFGFIIESDDTIVIGFRGTMSTADTISDLLAIQIPYPWVPHGGQTHRGFTEIYATARQQILTALSKCAVEKKVLITGHSLGGALATLCAFDLAYTTTFKSPSVYTYGAPRVGDPAFAAAYNRTIAINHRLAIESDLIPLIPPPIYKTPKSKVFLYLHVKGGKRLHYISDSLSKNHALSNYFTVLAKHDSDYANSLCNQIPVFCPI